jgi:mono/diheme cytochrome c family protein
MCSVQVRSFRAMLVAAIPFLLLSACGGGGGGYDDDAPPQAPAATPPTVTLSAPTTASVNRTVRLSATPTASAGVSRVEFLVDGTVIANLTAAPYETQWDTSTIPDGAHTVTARVTDAANAVATSSPATVTVNNRPTITVTLSPQETYPLPNSTASGTGQLTFNLITGAVSGGVTVSGITATVAHIHRQYAGANGPVIVDFQRSAADPNRWEPVANDVLTADEINHLLAGRLYVNVHSSAYPGGEIRGQVRPENIRVVITPLAGTQVVPPVTSTASGVAATTIDTAASTATVHLNTTATDATAAHVHAAASGASNTNALLTLQRDPANTAHWLIELQPITTANITEFDANGWYADVHTPANSGGELRGQITPNPAPAPPPPPPPPAAPTLADLQSTIFTPNCSGCHTGGGTTLPASMNLSSAASTHAAVVGVASSQRAPLLRVAAGDAENSYLVHKIEGRAGIAGGRMPLGGTALSQTDIDRIKAWINAGAANN